MLIDRKESNYDEENEMYKKVYPIRFVHDEIININDGWECGEEHNILLSVPDEDDENEYEYEH